MRKSSLAAAIVAARSEHKWFTSKDFKGQDRIPHNPRNNRKTKKGGKRRPNHFSKQHCQCRRQSIITGAKQSDIKTASHTCMFI